MSTNNIETLRFGQESLFVSSQQLFLREKIRKTLVIYKTFDENEEHWLVPHFPFEDHLYQIGPNALPLIKEHALVHLDFLSVFYMLLRYETVALRHQNQSKREHAAEQALRLNTWIYEKLKKHPHKPSFEWIEKEIRKHFPIRMIIMPFVPKVFALCTDELIPKKIWDRMADLMMAILMETPEPPSI